MIYIYSTIIVLAILIFVHELGHFIFAKIFKVYVEQFSLGFGPKLFSFKKKETEYKISLIPLGGYVKLLGESEEDEIPEGLENFSYKSKKRWQKILIIFGGPLFNFLFAALVFAFLYMKGMPILQPYVGGLKQNMPAIESGIQKGDKIIMIDNIKVNSWDEVSKIIANCNGKILTIMVKRNDKKLLFKVKPKIQEYKNIFGETKKRYFIGIIADTSKLYIKKFNLFEALKLGIIDTYKWIKLTILGIIKLIERVIPFNTIGGPLIIGQLAGEQAKQGLPNFLFFLAIISVNLGVFNLLPIPILDGGHILILLIESIIQRPIDLKKIEFIQKVGLSFLIALMIFAFYNDIIRILGHK